MSKLIRRSRSDRNLYIFSCVYITFTLLITIYPVYFTLIASFSDAQEVALGHTLLWFKGFHLAAYQAVFQHQMLGRAYLNTICYTVVKAVLCVVCTMMAGFVFSRKDLIGKKTFMFLILFTNYFSGGLIPCYFNMRNLGLYNTMWALIIPGLINTSNMIIARTYMRTSIPEALDEAAMIDGCPPFNYFIKIVLPLSVPIIGVFLLYTAVGQWNSYMDAMIYLEDRSRYPLQLILREILVNNQINIKELRDVESMSRHISLSQAREMLKYALIIVSSVPMLALYPFCQKFFIKGVMVGSLKG